MMPTTKKEEFVVAPKFSSDIDYLQRIGWLIRQAQDCAVYNEFNIKMLNILEQIYIEILPRVGNPEDREKLLLYRNNAFKVVMKGDNKMRIYLIKYQTLINLMSHKYKLIMQDAETIDSTFERGI